MRYPIIIITHILRQTMIISRISRILNTLHRTTPAYAFSKDQDQDNNYGIKFDEELIRKKMKEIENRKAGNAETQQKQPKFQFMTNTVNLQLHRKIKKYRESTNSENLLQFTDVTFEEKPTTLQITGYNELSLQVDGSDYPPTMIIFPKQALIWQVLNTENLTMDDFIILKYISPAPTYVIVGVSDTTKFPREIKEELTKRYRDFDVLEIFEAISQFNVTANDDINVVAFLISK